MSTRPGESWKGPSRAPSSDHQRSIILDKLLHGALALRSVPAGFPIHRQAVNVMGVGQWLREAVILDTAAGRGIRQIPNELIDHRQTRGQQAVHGVLEIRVIEEIVVVQILMRRGLHLKNS